MDRETAEHVRDTCLRFRSELREAYPAVEASSTPEDLARFNNVLSRVFHHPPQGPRTNLCGAS